MLDLGSTYATKLDGSIKGLLGLKYLRINHPSLKRLPSLCNLSDLQTLDIKSIVIYMKHMKFFKVINVPNFKEKTLKTVIFANEYIFSLSLKIYSPIWYDCVVFPSIKPKFEALVSVSTEAA